MWRCINDVFSYCHGTPDAETLTEYTLMAGETHHVFPINGCKNEPGSCKKYRKFSEIVKGVK